MIARRAFYALPLALALALAGCGDLLAPAEPEAPPPPAGPSADKGVDVATKVVRVGTLNDLSGPGALDGQAWATGKRVLVAQVNAGGSGLLPDGWTLELVERDVAGDGARAAAALAEIQDQVLFLGTSHGAATDGVASMVGGAGLVAFPSHVTTASLANPLLVPTSPTVRAEARRAVDHLTLRAGGPKNVKLAVVYEAGSVGMDALDGVRQAAALNGLQVVSEVAAAPGMADFAALAGSLKASGASQVVLALPPAYGSAVLTASAGAGFEPSFYAVGPTWSDAWFRPEVVPPSALEDLLVVSGRPYAGEVLPAAAAYQAAFAAHGGGAAADAASLASYAQGLVALDAVKRSIDAGDVTRGAFHRTLQASGTTTANGLLQPVTLASVPYAASENTRVLKPDLAARTFTVLGDWAPPSATPVQPFTRPAGEGMPLKSGKFGKLGGSGGTGSGGTGSGGTGSGAGAAPAKPVKGGAPSKGSGGSDGEGGSDGKPVKK